MSEQPFPAGCWCVVQDDPVALDMNGVMFKVGGKIQYLPDYRGGGLILWQEVIETKHEEASKYISVQGLGWPVRYLRRIDDDLPTDEEVTETLEQTPGDEIPMLDEVMA